jgi:hypothetical protein
MIRRRISIPARSIGRAGVFPLPREPPAAAPNSPQCAARSRAREKRTLAAFLPSRAAASVLAAAGRARRRAKAANTCACSPWAQGPLEPTSQTRPISIEVAAYLFCSKLEVDLTSLDVDDCSCCI